MMTCILLNITPEISYFRQHVYFFAFSGLSTIATDNPSLSSSLLPFLTLSIWFLKSTPIFCVLSLYNLQSSFLAILPSFPVSSTCFLFSVQITMPSADVVQRDSRLSYVCVLSDEGFPNYWADKLNRVKMAKVYDRGLYLYVSGGYCSYIQSCRDFALAHFCRYKSTNICKKTQTQK